MVLQHLRKVWERGPQMGFQFLAKESTNSHPIFGFGKAWAATGGSSGAGPRARPGWGPGVPAADRAVPLRLSPKRRQDGPKGSSARSSRSPSSPSPQRSASPHQNGHKGSAQNGRHSHGAPLPEPSDVRRLFLDHSSLPCPPPSTGLPPCFPLPSFPTRSAPRPAQPEHTGEMWGAGCTLPALTNPALGARSPWGSQPITLRQGSGQTTGHPSPKATCHPADVTPPRDDGSAGQHHLPLGSAPP